MRQMFLAILTTATMFGLTAMADPPPASAATPTKKAEAKPVKEPEVKYMTVSDFVLGVDYTCPGDCQILEIVIPFKKTLTTDPLSMKLDPIVWAPINPRLVTPPVPTSITLKTGEKNTSALLVGKGTVLYADTKVSGCIAYIEGSEPKKLIIKEEQKFDIGGQPLTAEGVLKLGPTGPEALRAQHNVKLLESKVDELKNTLAAVAGRTTLSADDEAALIAKAKAATLAEIDPKLEAFKKRLEIVEEGQKKIVALEEKFGKMEAALARLEPGEVLACPTLFQTHMGYNPTPGYAYEHATYGKWMVTRHVHVAGHPRLVLRSLAFAGRVVAAPFILHSR